MTGVGPRAYKKECRTLLVLRGKTCTGAAVL